MNRLPGESDFAAIHRHVNPFSTSLRWDDDSSHSSDDLQSSSSTSDPRRSLSQSILSSSSIFLHPGMQRTKSHTHLSRVSSQGNLPIMKDVKVRDSFEESLRKPDASSSLSLESLPFMTDLLPSSKVFPLVSEQSSKTSSRPPRFPKRKNLSFADDSIASKAVDSYSSRRSMVRGNLLETIRIPFFIVSLCLLVISSFCSL